MSVYKGQFKVKPMIQAQRAVGAFEEKPEEKVSTVKDVLLSPFRGIEGAIQDTYGFVDKLLLGDVLPDYTDDNRLFGRSKTAAGQFGEHLFSWLTVFVPVVGAVGKAGKIGKVAKVMRGASKDKLGYAASRKAAKAYLRTGNAAVSPKHHKTLRTLKGNKRKKWSEIAGAGAIADGLAFDGAEAKLSDLLVQYPALENPVTTFLSSKEDDNEAVGRLKNILEGLLIEAGVGGAIQLTKGVVKGFKAIRTKRHLESKGVPADEAAEQALAKHEITPDDIYSGRGMFYSGPEKMIPQGNALPQVPVPLLKEGDKNVVENYVDNLIRPLLHETDGFINKTLRDHVKQIKKYKTVKDKDGKSIKVVDKKASEKSQRIFLDEVDKRFDPKTGMRRTQDSPISKKELEIREARARAESPRSNVEAGGLVKVVDSTADAGAVVIGPKAKTTLGKQYDPTQARFRTNIARASIKTKGKTIQEVISELSKTRKVTQDDVDAIWSNWFKESNKRRNLLLNALAGGKKRNLLGDSNTIKASSKEYDKVVAEYQKSFGKKSLSKKQLDELKSDTKPIKVRDKDGKLVDHPTRKRQKGVDEKAADKARLDKYVKLRKDLKRLKPKEDMPTNISHGKAIERALNKQTSAVAPKAPIEPPKPTKPTKPAKPDTSPAFKEGDEIADDTGIVWKMDDDKNWYRDLENGQREYNIDSAGKFNKELEARTVSAHTDKQVENARLQFDSNGILTGGHAAIRNIVKVFTENNAKSDEIVALVGSLKKTFREKGAAKKFTEAELIEQSTKDIEDISGLLNKGDKDAWMARLHQAQTKGNLDEFRAEQKALFYLTRAAGELLQNQTRSLMKTYQTVGDFDAKAIIKDMNLKGAPNQEIINFTNALDMFGETARIWSLMGREASISLLQRQVLYNNGWAGLKHVNNSVGMPSRLADDAKGQINFVKQITKNEKQFKAVLKMFAMATESADIQTTLARLGPLTRDKRFMDMHNMVREYWMNSLLSGPTTQIVNLIGNTISGALRTVETAVGAAIRGDADLVKAVLRFSFDMNMWRESIKVGKMAFRTSEGVTVGAGKSAYTERWTAQAAITGAKARGIVKGNRHITTLKGQTIGRAIDFIGNSIIRIPTRALLAGDEFFKSMNYRAYVQTEIAADGYRKGLSGNNLARYVKEELDNHMVNTNRKFSDGNLKQMVENEADEAGLRFKAKDDYVSRRLQEEKATRARIGAEQEKDFGDGFKSFTDEERVVLAKRAEEYSLVNTFTNETSMPLIKGLSNVVSEMPVVGFIVPFIRTPANILIFATERTGLGIAAKAKSAIAGKGAFKVSPEVVKEARKSQQRLKSGDARLRSEEIGKLSTAVTATTALTWMCYCNRDNVTGFGPSDPNQRKAWKEAGNQEYSIRIGDRWYSYARLDPIATLIGIHADMAYSLENPELEEEDRKSLEGVVTQLAIVFKNNILNKSFLQGLDTAMDAVMNPEREGIMKPVKNVIGGFAPNIINQFLNAEDKRILYETAGWFDVFHQRLGNTENLRPKRDALGNIITKETWGGLGNPVAGVANSLINPVYTRGIKDDLVYNELNAQGGLGMPSHLIKNSNINLKRLTTNNGSNVYDTYLEKMGTTQINGLTLHQAMDKLIRSNEYQNIDPELADGDGMDLMSRRKRELIKLRSAYMAKARRETLGQSKQYRDAYEQHYRLQKGLH